MPRFCANCGAQIVEDAAFCPACGKAVGNAKAAAPGAAAATPATVTAPPDASQGTAQPRVYAPASAIPDNLAGLLAYLFIPAIVFLFVEPYRRNQFIRFHSWQSILVAGSWIVVSTLLGMIGMTPMLALLTMPLFMVIWIGYFVLWIVLMIKAYSGVYFKLPVLGAIAERQANSGI